MEQLLKIFFRDGELKPFRLLFMIVLLQLLIWGSPFTGALLIVKYIFF